MASSTSGFLVAAVASDARADDAPIIAIRAGSSVKENDEKLNDAFVGVDAKDAAVAMDGDSSPPVERASWLSRITFAWMDPIFRRGWRHPLVQDDIWPVPSHIRAETLADRFFAQWGLDLAEYRKRKAEGSFPKGKEPVGGDLLKGTLFKLYFRPIIVLLIPRVLGDFCNVFSPYFVRFILTWAIQHAVNAASAPLYQGVLLVLGLFLAQVIGSLFVSNFTQTSSIQAQSMRSMLTAVIYRKTVKLTSAARAKYNSGAVINMVSTDSNRVEQFINFCVYIVSVPILLTVNIIFLYLALGWASFVGVSVLIFTFPLQSFLFDKIKTIRQTQAPITDKRVRQTTEILNGIRVIKFFGWEVPFANDIASIRRGEITQVLKRAVIQSLVMTQAFSIPILCSCIAFITYGLTSPLDPSRIFSSLAWFNQLRFPIYILPNVLNTWAEFNVAMARIEGLLLASEVEITPPSPADPTAENAITITDGEFEWGGEIGETLPESKKLQQKKNGSKKPHNSSGSKDSKTDNKPPRGEKVEVSARPSTSLDRLTNIDLAIPRGKLVAVVGAVGSGKSSLLNAMIGEMRKVSGSINFSGRISYAAQSAWIKNASMRDNILFDEPYDSDRYLRALSACALLPDLRVLPDGDQTSIGERGINLSGGQKQRVNLARLVYNDADICLIDDPLSAVDAHVGRHLFHECIRGALKGKTRVLVTHQLHFLPLCDLVVVMKDGCIAERGTYEELVQSGGPFADLIKNFGSDDEKASDDGDDPKDTVDGVKDNSKRLEELRALVEVDRKAKDIMQVEDRETGKVSSLVWWGYFKACGSFVFLVELFFILIFLQGSRVGNDLWLTWWTANSFNLSSNINVGVYTVFGISQCLMTFIYAYHFAVRGTRAARVLHEGALARILRAPVSFFDTTPIGRIVNRFSRDVDAVDNNISFNCRQLVQQLAIVFSTFAVMCYAIPLFTIPVLPAVVMYYFIQNVYRFTSRELKRLDSTTKSPLYANFGETLTGLGTIRAYRNERHFVRRNDESTNSNNAPYYLLLTAQSWLSFRLQVVGAMLVLLAGLIGVFSPGLSASFFGLALSYSLSVTQVLSMSVQNFTQTEIAMNSVERVVHYAEKVDVEPPAYNEKNKPSQGWPKRGVITFRDVSMRYASHLPLVLDSVSFEVADGQKVGIVGRTGSGKSSLVQALFRMFEISGGEITIDGVNIHGIGLHDLRTSIAIIPQDPVVFSGTFRSNIDPFSQYDDAQLWDAIDRAGLRPKVSRTEGGLDANVDGGGENLSVGERQLLCLSRALLKKPRILVMDEATANVDYETDAMIQRILRQDFLGATILTIAHRLNTIIDYDRVLVMDAGHVAEYDTPKALLENIESMFSVLVAQTGDSNASLLKELARKSAAAAENGAD